MSRQEQAPLLEALLAYSKLPIRAFHTPGHKQGAGLDSDLASLLENYARGDVSLMGDELDDPFAPTSCILEAQERLAELYGANRSYFSAIGTTGALQILSLASFKEGDLVFVPRNAHRSLWSSLVLTGARPVFLTPEWDEEWKIFQGISLETLEKAISRYPEAKGLFLISPTYYGVSGDLEKLIEKAHQNDLLVLLDEAHGVHLPFLKNKLPEGIRSGADGVAQSAHKFLGACTGASWLHIQGDKLLPEKIQQSFLALQTSSPNYPLLASLDGARRQMGVAGKALWGKVEELAQWLRQEINQITGLACLTEEEIRPFLFDPCKIAVRFDRLGLSGIEAASWLREKKLIQPELADQQNVLFLLTYADGKEQVEILLKALQELATTFQKQLCEGTPKVNSWKLPRISKVDLTPREVFFRNKVSIPFKESIGKIIGEPISFYPPGIPLIWPGEQMDERRFTQISEGVKAGLMVSGPLDGTLEKVRIVED